MIYKLLKTSQNRERLSRRGRSNKIFGKGRSVCVRRGGGGESLAYEKSKKKKGRGCLIHTQHYIFRLLLGKNYSLD